MTTWALRGLVLRADGDPEPVEVDVGQLRQVLQNRAINASQAMRDYVRIDVHDDGVGIPEHLLPRMLLTPASRRL